MRSMGHRDYVYRPWSEKRKATARAAARARLGLTGVGASGRGESRQRRLARARGCDGFDAAAAALILGGLGDEIAALSEGEAMALFAELRAPLGCEGCGCRDFRTIALRPDRRRCAVCRREIGQRSGTIFYRSKLTYRQILLALAVFGVGGNGFPARGLVTLLGVSLRTAEEIGLLLGMAGPRSAVS